MDFNTLREIAHKIYLNYNCEYDNLDYMYHIDMVVSQIEKHKNVFKYTNDYDITLIAGLFHDCIEDAKQSYSDISKICNNDIADVVLAVTDVNEANRLLRHLNTMGKTVKDHRAIILKLCDILANATYSKEHGSSMYEKYVEEYLYRRPIFMKTLNWYSDKLNFHELDKLWCELDEAHWGDKTVIFNLQKTIVYK